MQHLKIKEKYTQISSEISELINENIEDEDLKSVLIDFLYKRISDIDISWIDTDSSRYLLYVDAYALTQVVSSMTLINKINDLNWDFFCYIFNNQELCLELGTNLTDKPTYTFISNILKYIKNTSGNTAFNRFYYYLYTFYRYVYDLNKYNNLDNIKEIGNYYNIFVADIINSLASLRVITESNKDFLKKYIYSVYPIGSRYDDIILWSIPMTAKRMTQGLERTFNLVNSNDFIKAVFDAFINDFNRIEDYIKPLKLFIHLFNESCNSKIPCSLIEFDDDLFEIQFNYFNNLAPIYADDIKSKKLNLTKILLYFYRFVVNLSIKSDAPIGVSKQLQNAFQEKNFISYYKQGYKFMYHNKLEDYPPYDKVCLLPSIQSMNNAHTANSRALYYDTSEFNDKYKEDIKNFIWNNDGYLPSIISGLSIIKYFLKAKEVFDSDILDLMNHLRIVSLVHHF